MYRNSPIAAWRNQKTLYCLQGVACESCNHRYVSHVYRCICGCMKFRSYQFSGYATLIAYTQILSASIDFIQKKPFCIGILKLDEGPQVLMQLTDVVYEKLNIGMKMVAVFRKYFATGESGMIFYGLKFTPIDSV